MSDQHHNIHKLSAAGVLVTLGIIFGDIGTSPLYVLKAIIGEGKIINEVVVLGALSCIFWTLTMQTTLKYVILTLRADNNGEGGVFSLYALVRNNAKWLSVPAILGGSALLADGMITPPISVASAIEGLRNHYPQIETVPIVVVILILLFFFQRFGTSTVGKIFSPMMLVWFLMLATLGIFALVENPQVLKSLNPMYAYDLLVNYPSGFWLLGAVFLCTTGAEALYSDLGHCGRENIRISWIFVKTCLLLNYFGQGAWLLANAGTNLTTNPFYSIMHPNFMLIGVAISTMAAVIASQALISGSFTLISEAIHLGFWPKVKLSYPSDMRGQLYVSSLNLILAVGCIGIVFYFRESSAMEAAYGLAITLTMMMTSTLLLYYLLKVRKWNLFWVVGFAITYAAIEIAFLVANLDKFPHGGWVSLAIAFIFASVMFIWKRARRIIGEMREMTYFSPYYDELILLSTDPDYKKYATHLVYMTSSDSETQIEKKIIDSIFLGEPKRADIYWFVHVETVNEPYKMEYEARILAPNDIGWIHFRMGFREELRIDYFFKQVLAEVIKEKEISLGEAGEYQTMIGEKRLGDFKFVVLESFLSNASELKWYDDVTMEAYFQIKKISSNLEDWFGLDPSSAVTEQVPMIIYTKSTTKNKKGHKIVMPKSTTKLTRVFSKEEKEREEEKKEKILRSDETKD